MSKLPLFAMVVVLAACETDRTPAPLPPATPGTPAAQPGLAAPTDVGVPAIPGDSVGGDPGALPTLPQGVVLPVGFNGLGVLAEAMEPPVKKAPEWTRVAAQVVLRDNKRFLEATGRAERIKNAALARSTAENRARFELAKWLGNEKLEGSHVVESLIDPRTHTAFARVAIEVPEGWLPGQPLAPSAVPSVPSQAAQPQ